MSLLMDALRKAEQAKRQALAGQPGEEATGAQTTASPPRGKPLPELPQELSLLDDEFSNVSPRRPAPPPEPAPGGRVEDKARAAAQQLFSAKQPEPRAPLYLLLGLATLLALLAIGAWMWWQLSPLGGSGVAPATGLRTPPAASAPPMPRPAQPASPTPGAASLPTLPNATPAAPTGQAADATPQGKAQRPPQAQPGEGRAGPQAGTIAEAPHRAAAPARREAGTVRNAAPAAEEAAAAPSPTIPLRRTQPQSRVNSTVAAAWRAYQAGDLNTARSSYEQALRADPRSGDALNGLAAIAVREGRADLAERYTRLALEADPKDALAASRMLALRPDADAAHTESRLRSLLAEQPDSPHLHFSLGNLLAREGRWNEAQQAYFRAYSADAENPDYLFNLAVSLDHLRQPRLALQYYQSALSTAASRPAAFDRGQAAQRLRELQP
ncbi:MAG: tetratricopeptide repeat protein [Betaproteobacteria bacterium]|nr:tetratricopeptide repeat protein [Betaproteobacteria bacterium]